MPSAYSVPMASDVLPDPDTPTTATVRHSGTSTSTSRRLLCRAPRTPMTVGRVPGTGMSPAGWPAHGTGCLCVGSVSLGIGVFAFTGDYRRYLRRLVSARGGDEVESGADQRQVGQRAGRQRAPTSGARSRARPQSP